MSGNVALVARESVSGALLEHHTQYWIALRRGRRGGSSQRRRPRPARERSEDVSTLRKISAEAVKMSARTLPAARPTSLAPTSAVQPAHTTVPRAIGWALASTLWGGGKTRVGRLSGGSGRRALILGST